jgi:hypothetical protein
MRVLSEVKTHSLQRHPDYAPIIKGIVDREIYHALGMDIMIFLDRVFQACHHGVE